MKTLLLLLAMVLSAPACEVPVFRFALERWFSDPLVVEVVADGPGGPEGEAGLRWLRNQMPGQAKANVTIRFTEPAHPGDGRVLMRLLQPATRQPGNAPWWEGPMTGDNARDLTGSPLREKIAAELLDGTSAVWIVVSQGDLEADARTMAAVEKGIDRAMRTLSLPKGVIEPQDAARKMAMFPNATMDDVLRTNLPLRIRFKALLLRHDDPREVILRDLLVSAAPARPPGEPLIAPIFGRGRVLPPAPASAVGEEGVFQGCAYLCGACACMVKQQNPGVDLPFRVDWDSHLKPHLVTIDRATGGNPPEVVEYGKPPAAPAESPQPEPARRLPLGMIIGCLLFVAIIAAVLWKRAP